MEDTDLDVKEFQLAGGAKFSLRKLWYSSTQLHPNQFMAREWGLRAIRVEDAVREHVVSWIPPFSDWYPSVDSLVIAFTEYVHQKTNGRYT